MQAPFTSNLDKFHTADFTVVEDTRQIPVAARAVHPLNNINYIEPGGAPKQWITVQLDNGMPGTLILTGEQQLDVQPGDVVSTLLAKRGAFGRAQQTLVYIKNVDTGQELLLPSSTVFLQTPVPGVKLSGNLVGLLCALPSMVHLTQAGSNDPVFIAGALIGIASLFVLSRFAAKYLITTAVLNKRNKAFQTSVVEEALTYFKLKET